MRKTQPVGQFRRDSGKSGVTLRPFQKKDALRLVPYIQLYNTSIGLIVRLTMTGFKHIAHSRHISLFMSAPLENNTVIASENSVPPVFRTPSVQCNYQSTVIGMLVFNRWIDYSEPGCNILNSVIGISGSCFCTELKIFYSKF